MGRNSGLLFRYRLLFPPGEQEESHFLDEQECWFHLRHLPDTQGILDSPPNHQLPQKAHRNRPHLQEEYESPCHQIQVVYYLYKCIDINQFT